MIIVFFKVGLYRRYSIFDVSILCLGNNIIHRREPFRAISVMIKCLLPGSNRLYFYYTTNFIFTGLAVARFP